MDTSTQLTLAIIEFGASVIGIVFSISEMVRLAPQLQQEVNTHY